MARTQSGKEKRLSMGLAFFPEEARHGFLLDLSSGQAETAPVRLSEHRDWELRDGELAVGALEPSSAELRVIVERFRWDAVSELFWEDCARRLKSAGIAAPRMPKKGRIPIHSALGKELCVLLWSIEDAEPALIPEAVRNWEGLAPEERWWLYTMTAAATGQAQQRGTGWRKALRFALTENPIIKGEGLSPKMRRQMLSSGQMSFF